jgi:hypothetical protein
MSFVLIIVIVFTPSNLFGCFPNPIYHTIHLCSKTVCNSKCVSLLKDHVSYDNFVLTSYTVNAPKIALCILNYKLYMHILSRVHKVQVTYTNFAYSTYGYVHIKSRLLQLYGTTVPPPPQPCHVIVVSPPAANGNATGGGIGRKQQQHARVLTGGMYTARTVTLVATCTQYAYSCNLCYVLYGPRVKTNVFTSTLCFRELALKRKEAHLNIPNNYCRFKSSLDLSWLVLQKVLGYYFAITLFELCRYLLPPSRAFGRGKKNISLNICLSLQPSKIISVPNRFEKMSDFQSPGKETSHGKLCQPNSANLISACVPFFVFRLTRNLYKTCSYILYILYVLYMSCPFASILTDPPSLCVFTSLIIPAAYICILYSGNGSKLYGE